jgi:rubrerythrin
MTREIRETYNVDLEDLKDILETIIRDEEIHRVLLSKMKKIIVGKEKQAEDKAPQVKYKSPDSWTAHIPAGIT